MMLPCSCQIHSYQIPEHDAYMQNSNLWLYA